MFEILLIVMTKFFKCIKFVFELVFEFIGALLFKLSISKSCCLISTGEECSVRIRISAHYCAEHDIFNNALKSLIIFWKRLKKETILATGLTSRRCSVRFAHRTVCGQPLRQGSTLCDHHIQLRLIEHRMYHFQNSVSQDIRRETARGVIPLVEFFQRGSFARRYDYETDEGHN